MRTTLKNRKGVAMIEYALLAVLIALVAVGALQALGLNVFGVFQNISDSLTNN